MCHTGLHRSCGDSFRVNTTSNKKGMEPIKVKWAIIVQLLFCIITLYSQFIKCHTLTGNTLQVNSNPDPQHFLIS